MQSEDSSAPPPKRIYGRRYQVDATLGSGAMGDVFAARHLLTGQRVALKVLHPHVARHMPSHERFLREVRVAARIEHPDVVKVFDAAVEDGEMFFAMELLAGQTFAAWWSANPGATGQALALIRQALEPLAAAHAAGVVHRDIKPDNLFVVDADRPVVKLIDFGIARDDDARKATQTGLTVGTPFYMSPEQALDPTRCAPAADVWSVGVMLYEALAGRLPFEGPTAQAVCMRMLSEKHRPLREVAPAVDPAIAAVVERCLAKRPAERPADARALADLLDEAQGRAVAAPRAAAGPAPTDPDAPGAVPSTAASVDPTEPVLPGDPSRARWAIVGVAALLALAAALWPAREPAEPARGATVAQPPAAEPAAPARTAPEAPAPKAPAPEAPAPEAPAPEAPTPEAPEAKAPAPEAPAPEAPAPDRAAPPAPAVAEPAPPAPRPTIRRRPIPRRAAAEARPETPARPAEPPPAGAAARAAADPTPRPPAPAPPDIAARAAARTAEAAAPTPLAATTPPPAEPAPPLAADPAPSRPARPALRPAADAAAEPSPAREAPPAPAPPLTF